MKTSSIVTTTAASALLAALALSGCSRPHEDDTQTASAERDRTATVSGQPSAADTAAKASRRTDSTDAQLLQLVAVTPAQRQFGSIAKHYGIFAMK